MGNEMAAAGTLRGARDSTQQLGIARFMYGANIVAAGVPGLVITFAPGVADGMFAGAQEAVTFSMLGATWLAIGVVSVLGLRDPRRYAGVFALQAVYKTIWIVTGAIPLWSTRPDVLPYAIGFAIAVVGFVGAFAATRRSTDEPTVGTQRTALVAS